MLKIGRTCGKMLKLAKLGNFAIVLNVLEIFSLRENGERIKVLNSWNWKFIHHNKLLYIYGGICEFRIGFEIMNNVRENGCSIWLVMKVGVLACGLVGRGSLSTWNIWLETSS